jgi:tRNA A22 N-methylase
MTQTIQSHSSTYLSEEEKILETNKPLIDGNRDLLLQLFDSLNNLYKMLSRLTYKIQKEKIEQLMYQKVKEKRNEN